jgi:hypothetical protein
MFFIRGSAPPPSRKLTERPTISPVLVEARSPEKYGRRLTLVPLTSPSARIPGTLMPTFGVVSMEHQQVLEENGISMYLQFPMTAVLTTRVKRVIWFSAVLFVNRAVV